MISIKNLAMSYGSKLLFTDVTLNLNVGDRYALVGANGSGKSTFLRLFAGEEEPLDGEVSIPKRYKVGWLKQDQFLYENTRIVDTVIAGKKALWEALKEKEEILAKEEFVEEDGYKLGELEEVIFENDGYTAEVIAAELLVGLGIKEEYHHQPLSALSGGYKLRVLLAQSLFENPDVLLLDEPTNHLDLQTIYWLENYLKNTFKGILVVISHDTVFLNNLATTILDIDYGEIRPYIGNYDNFVVKKQLLAEAKLSERADLEKKIEKMKVFIEKFRASATRSKQSASREKLIDKMELPTIDKSSRLNPKFNFTQVRPSGKTVLTVSNVSKSFKEKKVLNNISINIQRGEKVIIVGPNGIGKSTLLKIIVGNLKPDEGNVEWGYETKFSYFAQDHHELLNESISVFDWMQNYTSHDQQPKVRTILGNVLFRKEEIEKNILNLSGGEAGRLLIAKMILEEANVLILDEPTNHFDIETKDELKRALVDFKGTVIMVTHDRDFAMSVADRIIAITPRRVTDFKGKYEEYLAKNGSDFLQLDKQPELKVAKAN
ncbi:MAG: ABC-F family ATP-binding cassette domain-containing protein [Sphingobacteriia bacterium]|nr:ABC-F family ATP-binding cassette domain-containing protein [Sphingobacteriia bacterium]